MYGSDLKTHRVMAAIGSFSNSRKKQKMRFISFIQIKTTSRLGFLGSSVENVTTHRPLVGKKNQVQLHLRLGYLTRPTLKSESDRITLVWGWTDTPTDILPKGSARCVQSFDDSLDSAIRMTYRISLRSSSLWEPRHPLLKVLVMFFHWMLVRDIL